MIYEFQADLIDYLFFHVDFAVHLYIAADFNISVDITVNYYFNYSAANKLVSFVVDIILYGFDFD